MERCPRDLRAAASTLGSAAGTPLRSWRVASAAVAPARTSVDDAPRRNLLRRPAPGAEPHPQQSRSARSRVGDTYAQASRESMSGGTRFRNVRSFTMGLSGKAFASSTSNSAASSWHLRHGRPSAAQRFLLRYRSSRAAPGSSRRWAHPAGSPPRVSKCCNSLIAEGGPDGNPRAPSRRRRGAFLIAQNGSSRG